MVYKCKEYCPESLTFRNRRVKIPSMLERAGLMTTTLEQHDWAVEPARRTNSMQAGDITAILAEAGATGIITFSGGFPDPDFLPQDKLAAISSRVISADPGIALQYSATQGLA